MSSHENQIRQWSREAEAEDTILYHTRSSSPFDVQPGGDHYKKCAIQPTEYNHRNNLGFCEGNVVKYVTRWRSKNGIEDLEKAKHYIELLIAMETR